MVSLGLKEGIDRAAMERDLRVAQTGEKAFPAETYVNTWPVEKHSHVSIPAGTIHCSGKNGMVLEISATPYIFTFKLWDWGRLESGWKAPAHPSRLWHREYSMGPVDRVGAREPGESGAADHKRAGMARCHSRDGWGRELSIQIQPTPIPQLERQEECPASH